MSTTGYSSVAVFGMATLAGEKLEMARRVRDKVKSQNPSATFSYNPNLDEPADLVLVFWVGNDISKPVIDWAMRQHKDTVVVYPDGRFMKVGYGNVYGGFGD